MNRERLESVQVALRELDIPAWLLYDFRRTNPIAARIAGIPADAHQTRRWACLIPAEGEPLGLVHRIEPHLARMMGGNIREYSSQIEFEEGVGAMIQGMERVAMEYSPRNALPVVAKVDAGTVELVRSFGVEVVSSGELIARLEGKLTGEQIASAIRAGKHVREIMMDAFGFIRERITTGARVTEYDVQQQILSMFASRALVYDHPPICGAGPNSADPHYEPTAGHSREITRNDFVLIDLWGREEQEGTVFGDITWTGYVGAEVPERNRRIFEIVRDARDAALNHLRNRFAAGESVTGAELDDAARRVIADAGYGERFVHRTGHSITTELHGAGVNLDNFETRDTRFIVPGSSFSIEPGIYLPGDFGVRSELDVVVDVDGTILVPSDPVQTEVVPILGE